VIALPSLKHRSILIVVDNNDNQALLVNALKAASVENPLLFADNAPSAQGILQDSGGQADAGPCLVLLDLSKSEQAALELLRAMRTEPKTRRIPVILMTYSDQSQDLMAYYNAGVNSCIVKTGNRDAFYEKINCLCNYWLDICQLPA
jgi:two-component system response regulator